MYKSAQDENLINDVLKERVKSLEELTDIQCSDGNWNFDSYMRGMANGMILSVNVMNEDLDNPYTGQKSKRPFLDAPKEYKNSK